MNLDAEENKQHVKTSKVIEQLQLDIESFKIEELENTFRRKSKVMLLFFEDLLEYFTFLVNKNGIIAEILEDLFHIRHSGESEKVEGGVTPGGRRQGAEAGGDEEPPDIRRAAAGALLPKADSGLRGAGEGQNQGAQAEKEPLGREVRERKEGGPKQKLMTNLEELKEESLKMHKKNNRELENSEIRYYSQKTSKGQPRPDPSESDCEHKGDQLDRQATAKAPEGLTQRHSEITSVQSLVRTPNQMKSSQKLRMGDSFGQFKSSETLSAVDNIRETEKELIGDLPDTKRDLKMSSDHEKKSRSSEKNKKSEIGDHLETLESREDDSFAGKSSENSFENRSLTSHFNESTKAFLTAENKAQIFKRHMEYSIKNIELVIDLRRENMIRKKSKMKAKINELFREILVEMDDMLAEALGVSQEDIYRDHFHNIFDFKKENKTIQGRRRE